MGNLAVRHIPFKMNNKSITLIINKLNKKDENYTTKGNIEQDLNN